MRRRRVGGGAGGSDSPRAGDPGSALGGSAGAATPLGQPALAQAPTLVFGVPSPHPGFLVGLQGVGQAVLAHRALDTDGLGGFDLVYGRSGGADGKEEVGLGIPASSGVTPIGDGQGVKDG